MDYQRADFGPLRDTIYGIGIHWTSHTVTQDGKYKPYDEMVADFDVDRFVQQAVECGAGHVLFTTNHHIYQFPCPNPEVDRIIPGRTSERDLLMEVTDGLASFGIPMIFYHWHGMNCTNIPLQDPEFQNAMGSFEDDTTRYYENLCRILEWMGNHYGSKAIAWWFDAGYHLAEKGEVPWAQVTQAAKAGHADRLVCYNSGIENHECYTPYQDYWAGELTRLNFLPREKLTPAGLPWYAFTDWHPNCNPIHRTCGQWVLDQTASSIDWPAPPPESIAWYVQNFQAVGGAVTFNLLCYANGQILPNDLQAMKGLRNIIRKS